MASAPKCTLPLTALALAVASIGSHAAPISWATDTSGTWSLPSNWTPTGLPDANSDVVITVTGLKTITHDSGDDTIHTLNFDASSPDPNATLLVNGGSSLTINAGGGSGGVIRADNGTVRFNGGTFTNSGVVQTVNNGSVVFSNSTLAGGTIAGGSGGTVSFTNGALIDGLSNGTITNNGSVVVNTGQNVFVQGTIAGNGTITQQNNSDLRITNGQSFTLAGTGALTMTAGDSRVFSNDGSGTLTTSAGATIQGVGQIGLSQTTIANAGVITANVGGQTLIIDPRDGEGGLLNTGTLRAENGGTLQLYYGSYNNQAGTIAALTGSSVVLNSAIVEGGVLTSTGTGTVTAVNGSVLDGSTHGAITNTGSLILGSGQNVFASGSIVDNHGITQQGNSDLRISNGQSLTLSGTGALSMTAGDSRVFSNDGSGTLTNSAGYTIQGIGQIGLSQTTIANAGVITANVGGQTLIIDPRDGEGGLLNTGTLRAENGGTLQLYYGSYNNQAGTIAALTGSSVVLNNAIVEGGVLTSTGTGTVTAVNGSVLDGSTHGAITNTGSLILGSGQNVFASGSIVDNHGITQQGNSDLRISSGQSLTLSGTGALSMTAGDSRVFSNDGSGTLTNSAGYTIQGIGQIGLSQTTIANAGVITANVGGQTLIVDPRDGDGGLVNTGSLRAENGGTLQLNAGNYDNRLGTIAAANGSVVSVSSGTIQGGLLTSTGSGTVSFTGGATLDGTTHGAITNTGSVTIAAGQNVFVQGTVTDNGTIAQQGNSDLRINNGTSLALGGSGVYTMQAPDSRIFSNDGTGTLANGAGHTIQGIGQIGVNQTQVTNAGTIAANASGQTLNLVSSTPTVNQSTGTLLASNGGTLYLDKAVTGTGTIQTASGGTVILNQGATTGRLVNDANLSIGANNVTVSSDYSNANFGSGDTFNKHAGITGTGRILASGNVAQAITGATVTNGTTGSPTLTIGNVRVGGTTYNYQVANTGTDGPAIRGAIQTGVNGGNITDARLSGSGVTGGTYGPVAAGAASGNFAVTFTAAQAGALATLSGQAVHVGNNFDNLSEQTLNIALASGAAAYNAAVGSTTPSPVVVANQRVGGTNSQALTVANTAAAGNYSEALNASFTGATGAATTNGGSVSNVAAGASNSGALAVGVNTGTAGAKTGSVTIGYQTDGTGSNGHSGLAAIGAGSQTIQVSGNVYQTAAGNIVTAPLNFGTVQVGQTVSRQLTIANTATGAAGFVEDLNASFGAAFGTGASRITGSGSANGIVAGGTGGGLTVGVNTSTAGTVAGGIAVNFFSAGAVNGTSNGLGVLAVGSQNYGVNGTIATTANVVDQAAPVINNSPISLGNVRIGSASPTAAVSVTNQATGNQQAALSASIAGNAPITASGSFSLLNPGATDASSLHVGFDTSTAGAKNGTATISFVSDASNVGNCAPNCQMTLPSQTVGVSGAVYRLANPTVTTPSVTVAGRVGQAGPSTAIGVTNASPDVYTEGLNATRGATSAGFTSAGGIANLAAGASSSAITVALNTATAGTFSGTQTLNFASTGAGTTGASDLALASQTVALNGKVYTPAVAQQNTASVNFGIVHVGDSVAAQGVSVTNAASSTALNDVLVGQAIGATGPFTAAGNLGAGLAAQATSTNALTVGLNTATAGVYSGSATFSAASHDGDLSDAALANLAVGLSGQVNNYASDRFTMAGGAGTLTRNGSTFVLDYGAVTQGSGTLDTTLLAGNDASGPADSLNGTFQFLDAQDFSETGFAGFMGLAAGQSTGPLSFSFDSATLGDFMDTIVLHGVGTNASGYAGAIGDIELVVRGSVVAGGTVTPPVAGVPEPDSLWLLGLGVPLLFVRRRRAARPAH